MTVTVKLITEQTTNQLVDSVNESQTLGWYPVCGVVCFNARYTQLMAHDTENTTLAACDYFIVDSVDGVNFAQRVNQLLELNPTAVCLSSVQYAQARYIQAYGDDSMHHSGSGGGGGGTGLKWYTQDAAGTYPIIDVDPNLSQIGLGNEWAGYVQLLFRTGGNDAGHILADDGTLSIHKTDGTELNIMNDDVNMLVKNISVLNSNGEYTNLIAMGSHVTLAPGFAGMSSPGGSLELDEARGTQLYRNGSIIKLTDGYMTLEVDDHYVLNSDGLHTYLVGNGANVTLSDVYAAIVSNDAGSLDFNATTGIRLRDNGNLHTFIEATKTQATFGDAGLPATVKGAGVTLNANDGVSTMEMDANATRFKRGTNQLMSMSDSGGTQTWNSIIRAAWNADGWNVSHDTGVSFSSRATYSMMQAKSGARVETNATGTVIVSSDSTSLQSAINLTNTSIVSKKGTTTSTLDAAGFTKDTTGEYHYNIDGEPVFFSSGDITKIMAGDTFVSCDSGAGVELHSGDGSQPVKVSNPIASIGVDQYGVVATTSGEFNFSIDNVAVFHASADRAFFGINGMGIIIDKNDALTLVPGNRDVVLMDGNFIPTINGSEQLGTHTNPWHTVNVSGNGVLHTQTNSPNTNTIDAATIALMATLTPKTITDSRGVTSIGYVGLEVIMAFGEARAKSLGLAWSHETKEISVNQTAMLAMEALYIRSRLS